VEKALRDLDARGAENGRLLPVTTPLPISTSSVARKAGLSTVTPHCRRQFLPPDAIDVGIVPTIKVRNASTKRR
jgi:hypothetical protein